MGTIISQYDGAEAGAPVRCPICAQPNEHMRYCRHVRWTFDQGGPLELARFALETSPYITARGHSSREIPKAWWDEKAEWIVEKVLLHFDAADGYVFGELSDLDLLARDIWREFQPEPERPQMQRVDPV
ncbi:MAG TPA: hypothetical protein VJP07_11245 [Dehalococcoidia bacterium]|nr:hypothetical protein [Dehalococcoidia bacterium]